MVIENISFIVIARNEAFAAEKCLKSIASMPLNDCEVICVDSDSTDDTLDVMKGYIGRIENLRIIQISGSLNAAVARNAGMKYITKKYIFFVDGDIELCPEFLQTSVRRMQAGEMDAATGILDEIVYSEGFQDIVNPQSHRRYYPRARQIYDSGGTFIVRRQLVDDVGDWDERMVRNQDFDYTLRLVRIGRMMGLPVEMGIHHTLAYRQKPWLFLRKGYPIIFGMLIRKNLDQPRRLIGVLSNYRVGLIWYGLLACSMLMFTLLSLPLWPVWASFGAFALMDILWGVIKGKSVIGRFIVHYLDPLLIFLGLFVNYGRNTESTSVERIV